MVGFGYVKAEIRELDGKLCDSEEREESKTIPSCRA